ncbi:MAG TPA: hypothetical protein VFJ97_10715 [Dermatophilaceae bacterium]|nr:hypothetical protein [Dermatophilaceae bacterium]
MSQIDGSPDVAGLEHLEPVEEPSFAVTTALWVAAGLAVALQLFEIYRPIGPPQAKLFPSADKVGHLLGFAAPITLLLLARARQLRDADRLRRFAAVLMAVFGAHAVVSEVIQAQLYTHRTGDPMDAVADLTGTVLGWAGFLVFQRRQQRLGHPVPARARP